MDYTATLQTDKKKKKKMHGWNQKMQRLSEVQKLQQKPKDRAVSRQG